MAENVIYSINGPVVKVKDTTAFSMLERVLVGKKKLMGEVISISRSFTTIQVYESTTGLMPGEEVIPTGSPVSVTLAPGILRNIFDGIERPLQAIAERSGAFIATGSDVASLDEEKQWDVRITVKAGDHVRPGQVYATVQETPLIEHRCMVPPQLSGEVVAVSPEGAYRIVDEILQVKDDEGQVHSLTLMQKWPIKQARPVSSRLPISVPLITGQRIIDTLFPIAKGGTAAIPGGFGTGKTMTQHQLAKWCDADIIVYVGCGERGNEMTQVLEEFSELIDPKSQRPLMDRTVLIANTSNMPVAAREASIYTGLTLAEYYRDMGYHVAIMADSTSRWAEALREISGRLEEMPAEEGFPAYLPSRLSQFYERAGYVRHAERNMRAAYRSSARYRRRAMTSPSRSHRTPSVSCAVSGRWISHWPMPAIILPSTGTTSYSEYVGDLSRWYNHNVSPDFLRDRQATDEPAHGGKQTDGDRQVDRQRRTARRPEARHRDRARSSGSAYLQQNAFHQDDTYVPLEKQLKMMDTILYLYHSCIDALRQGNALSSILATGIFDTVTKMKYDVPNDHLELFDTYTQEDR